MQPRTASRGTRPWLKRRRQRPPFRADHVGSLLRPKELRDAFRRHAQRRARATRLSPRSRTRPSAMSCGCRRRRASRSSPTASSAAAPTGAASSSAAAASSIKPAVFKFRDDHGHEVDFTATYAAAKLTRTQPLATDEFAFLRSVDQGDAEDHHAGAVDHALLPLHGFRRPEGLCRRRDLLRRSCRDLPAGDRRSRQGRLPLHPARRGGGRHAVRSRHPRQGRRRRAGPRPAGRPLHQGHQRLRSPARRPTW